MEDLSICRNCNNLVWEHTTALDRPVHNTTQFLGVPGFKAVLETDRLMGEMGRKLISCLAVLTNNLIFKISVIGTNRNPPAL